MRDPALFQQIYNAVPGVRPVGDMRVTAVIPAIPPRVGRELHRALDSVMMQETPVDAISVAVDRDRQGSAVTRSRALASVQTGWSAFLDDDDEWYPDHVRELLRAACETGADMVYPWFNVPNGFDPFPWAEGQPFDPARLEHENTIPITCLIRTDILKAVGGFVPKDPAAEQDPAGVPSLCDDWGTWIRLRDAGAKIVHLNRRTWQWNWWSGNTSGRPVW